MLEYDESKNNGTMLEDIVCRTFTVDVDRFGNVEEVELVPNGRNISVTMDNRSEFVRLFIEYEFMKQCESQLSAFKRGFERMVDIQLLKTILTPEDLEQLICGQRTLDFRELETICIYGGSFNTKHKVVKWFWEIVLDEFTDDQRRLLLTFATGSDRAPVNGLKSMKFYLLEDVEDASDDKLPTSHTCFN
jgi:ubiquitin-protein ligase E3 A